MPQFSIMVCALFGGIAWWAERQRRRVGDGDPFPAKASRKHIGMAMSRLLRRQPASDPHLADVLLYLAEAPLFRRMQSYRVWLDDQGFAIVVRLRAPLRIAAAVGEPKGDYVQDATVVPRTDIRLFDMAEAPRLGLTARIALNAGADEKGCLDDTSARNVLRWLTPPVV